MSRLNELLGNDRAADEAARFIDEAKQERVPVVPTEYAPIQEVTSSKAKWGSLLPAILGGVAAPFTAQVLPDHILVTMGFWQYLVWILAQAGLFYGATFLNVYLSPPNAPK